MIFMSKAMYVLLLADVFENFRSMSLKIYELDPAKKKKKKERKKSSPWNSNATSFKEH